MSDIKIFDILILSALFASGDAYLGGAIFMGQLQRFSIVFGALFFISNVSSADYPIENNCYHDYDQTVQALINDIQTEVSSRNTRANFKRSCAEATNYAGLCGSPLQGNKKVMYYSQNSQGSQFLFNSQLLIKEQITAKVIQTIREKGMIPTSGCALCEAMEKDAIKNSELLSQSFSQYPTTAGNKAFQFSCKKEEEQTSEDKVSAIDACEMTGLSSNKNARKSTLGTTVEVQHRSECLLAAMVKNQRALFSSMALSFINDLTMQANHQNTKSFSQWNTKMAREKFVPAAKKCKRRFGFSKSCARRNIANAYKGNAAAYFQNSLKDTQSWIDQQFEARLASHKEDPKKLPYPISSEMSIIALGGLFLRRKKRDKKQSKIKRNVLPVLLIALSSIMTFSCSDDGVNPEVIIEPQQTPPTTYDIPIDADRGAAAIANNETLYGQLNSLKGNGGDVDPNLNLAAAKASPGFTGTKPSYNPNQNEEDLGSLINTNQTGNSGGNQAGSTPSSGNPFSAGESTTTEAIDRTQARSISLAEGDSAGLYSAGGSAPAKAGSSGALGGAMNAISGLFGSLTGGGSQNTQGVGSNEVNFSSSKKDQDQVWNDKSIIYKVPVGANIFKIVTKHYNETSEKWALQEAVRTRKIASQPQK